MKKPIKKKAPNPIFYKLKDSSDGFWASYDLDGSIEPPVTAQMYAVTDQTVTDIMSLLTLVRDSLDRSPSDKSMLAIMQEKFKRDEKMRKLVLKFTKNPFGLEKK